MKNNYGARNLFTVEDLDECRLEDPEENCSSKRRRTRSNNFDDEIELFTAGRGGRGGCVMSSGLRRRKISVSMSKPSYLLLHDNSSSIPQNRWYSPYYYLLDLLILISFLLNFRSLMVNNHYCSKHKHSVHLSRWGYVRWKTC